MHHISVTAQYSPREPAVSNNHHHATDLPLRPTTRNATWSVEYLESTFVMINNFPLIIKISSTPTKRLRFGTIRNMTLGSATCLAAERGTKRRTTTRRGRRAKIIGEMILDAEMAMTNSDIINVNILVFSRQSFIQFSPSIKQIHGDCRHIPGSTSSSGSTVSWQGSLGKFWTAKTGNIILFFTSLIMRMSYLKEC